MGLAEKRAEEEFKTKYFPEAKQKIDAAAGFDLPLEVDWSSLALEGGATKYRDNWNNIFFLPLEAALKAIGTDQMGRDASKEGRKKVVIQDKSRSHSPRNWTFKSGVLTLDHGSDQNGSGPGTTDFIERRDKIQKIVEAGL